MCTTIRIVLAMVREAFLSRAALHLENLALRQQLAALDRKGARPSLRMADRLFWVVLSRLWSGWREILVIVKPETVIGWHRKGFRRFWTRKSRRGKPGRPPVSSEFRGLIRRMSRENPLWGAPRIHGELRMLGFEVSEAAVSKYMPRHPKPPSQTWRTFLVNGGAKRDHRGGVRRDHLAAAGLSPSPWEGPGCDAACPQRNLSTTLRHRRFLFTDSFLLLWKWRVG